MTNQATPAGRIEEKLPARFQQSIVVTPPCISDTELGVTAVDVSLSGYIPGPTSGLVAICFGGHAAAECLLDAYGSGADHEIVVAIDETQPRHRQFAARLRGMIRPEKPVRVIPLPQEAG